MSQLVDIEANTPFAIFMNPEADTTQKPEGHRDKEVRWKD
jgi:hypothetical protein